jgi:hypothetical protein
MLTGEIRNQVDQIWNAFWSGGVSNPLSVIEQITYLLFIKRLDELHTVKGGENVLTQLAQSLLKYRIASEYALKQQIVGLVVNASILIFGGRVPLPSQRTGKTPRPGRVVITVGPGGLPEDLMVVNLSDLAIQDFGLMANRGSPVWKGLSTL